MKRKQLFIGTGTALVTPFMDGGKIDWKALGILVEQQIAGGVDFLTPCGTTGESSTLTPEEHLLVIRSVVSMARGRVPVLVGTGGNSTDEAISLTQEAERVGADASLQVAPYYNRPTQEGVFQHFRAVANATKLPIILYSIPGRCGIDIAVDTTKRLVAECPNIVGIKEAGGNPDRVSQLRAALGPKFTILSGDDSLTLPFMAVGAVGVVSVASNIIPRQVVQMVKAFASGRTAAALKLHEKYYQVFKDLFIESNPGPVKAALAMMGMIEEEYRLPLVPMVAENREKLRKVLEEYHLLESHQAPVKQRREIRVARVSVLD